MMDFAGKRLDKARDTQVIKIQSSLLYAANPLAKLWSEVVEQGLDQDPKALIPIADVLDTIQRALVLLGSANNTISETRHEIALGAAHSLFRKYAKGDFSETGTDLFGKAFKEVLVQKVDTDSALSKVVSIANKSAGPKVYQKPQHGRIAKSSHFFQGGGSVDKGTGSARPFLHTGTLGRENTPQAKVLQGNQVFSADWATAKQINTNLQINSRINRGSPKELKQAVWLQYFWQEWNKLTLDLWVLEMMKGYRIPFSCPPPNTKLPPFTFSRQEQKVISQEVQSLLDKGPIREVNPGQGFVNIFLVPKSGQRWRLILNLKLLNSYTVSEHFKMEDIRCVKDLLGKGDFMCKLDLRDAYLSIPVHPAHQKYLRFWWKGNLYQYTALTFELATAPRELFCRSATFDQR